jgi:hypothetical protein
LISRLLSGPLSEEAGHSIVDAEKFDAHGLSGTWLANDMEDGLVFLVFFGQPLTDLGAAWLQLGRA